MRDPWGPEGFFVSRLAEAGAGAEVGGGGLGFAACAKLWPVLVRCGGSEAFPGASLESFLFWGGGWERGVGVASWGGGLGGVTGCGLWVRAEDGRPDWRRERTQANQKVTHSITSCEPLVSRAAGASRCYSGRAYAIVGEPIYAIALSIQSRFVCAMVVGGCLPILVNILRLLSVN